MSHFLIVVNAADVVSAAPPLGRALNEPCAPRFDVIPFLFENAEAGFPSGGPLTLSGEASHDATRLLELMKEHSIGRIGYVYQD